MEQNSLINFLKIIMRANIMIWLLISSFCKGQSQNDSEMPIMRFIDKGYRIEIVNPEAEEVLKVGEKLSEISIQNIKNEHDTIIFRTIRNFVFENLIPYQIKFTDVDRMKIIRKYLAKRNSEEILNDGFYIGCGDICTLVGAILKKYEYDCQFIYAVSSNFSASNDLGHVFLYIEKGGNQYLYDPSMSNDIIIDYDPYLKNEIPIRSVIGDLFVFGMHQNSKKLGIVDMLSLNKKRTEAFKYWQVLK